MSRIFGDDLVEALTEREQEVLELLAEGKSNRELADCLVLSVHTVKWYNRQIYSKLGVSNRGQAVERARALRLLVGETEKSLPRHNLPRQTTAFVGRDRELADLDRYLLSRGTWLITITGIGGAGKTRLAMAVAERQVRRQPSAFPDGVYFVPLAPLRAADQIIPAIAMSIDLELQAAQHDERSPLQQLLSYLAGRRILLVLDNFEHLMEGGIKIVLKLLQHTSELKLIITSRKRLRVSEEQVYLLKGLAFTGNDSVEEARNSPLGQLFIQSARRVRPDFELEQEDLPSLVAIETLTDGLPLAIQLAASWADVLSLEHITAEIQHSLDFLATDLGGVSDRHHSIKAIFESSWRKLEPSLQAIFPQCSVFRGGFTKEAAESIVGVSPLLLQGLLHHCFLQTGRDGRYSIHELLRQFAAEKLAAQGEQVDQVHDRHSSFYCAMVARFAPEFPHATGRPNVARLNPEVDNVQAAWLWAVVHGRYTRLGQALEGLAAYCRLQGRTDLALACLEPLVQTLAKESRAEARALRVRALAILAHHTLAPADRSRRFDLVEKELVIVDPDHSWLHRPSVMRLLAEHLYVTDRPGGIYTMELALALAERRNNQHEQVAIMAALSWLYQFMGRFSEAIEITRQGIATARAGGHLIQLVELLAAAAELHWFQMRLVEARSMAEEGLQISRQIGYRRLEAWCLENMGHIMRLSGDFRQALQWDLQALDLCEALGQERLIAQQEALLGWSLVHLGQYDDASEHAARAIRLAASARRGEPEAYARGILGEIALAGEEYEEALGQLQMAFDILARLGSSGERGEVPYFLAGMGMAYIGLNRLKEARAAISRALSIAIQRRGFNVANALAAGALLASTQAEVRGAVEQFAAASRFVHVRKSHWFEDVVGRKLGVAAAGLAEEELQTAKARGQERDPWEMAAELLEILGAPLSE